ncbi:MAG: hypothetical protein M0Z40_08035 [Actinomycetota bacterium]|nr:hypothetical protein [Actinomycetota bacterium]
MNDRSSRPREALASSLAGIGNPKRTLSLAGLRGRPLLLRSGAAGAPAAGRISRR